MRDDMLPQEITEVERYALQVSKGWGNRNSSNNSNSSAQVDVEKREQRDSNMRTGMMPCKRKVAHHAAALAALCLILHHGGTSCAQGLLVIGALLPSSRCLKWLWRKPRRRLPHLSLAWHDLQHRRYDSFLLSPPFSCSHGIALIRRTYSCGWCVSA